MMNQLPPGPNTPQLWQLINWIADPLGYLEKNTQQYGDIFTLRMSNFQPYIFISNPQGIQEIFTHDAKSFDAGRANGIIKPLLGDNSLIVLDGDHHKQQRRLLMPPFHGERMHYYSQLIVNITEKIANKWQIGQTFLARPVMQDITLEVILNAVFGLSEGERYQQIKPLIAGLLDLTDSPLKASILFFKFLQKDLGAWSPWGWMMRRKQQLHDLLQAEIDERRNNHNLEANDILTLMLSARDENGEVMTDAELKDEMMTLLFAGHETTATALTWAFYWIYKTPEVKEKLEQELDNLDNKKDLFAITKLPYLSAVCQEVLRMYPVIPITFPRITKEQISIMGYDFEPETILAPCIYLTHHREDIYPDSDQFKPERFLDKQYSPYEYLPFGGGNRRCLGYALATLEMKLVLATVLANYELDLAETKSVKAQRRGLTIAPKCGVKMLLKSK